MPTKTFDRRTGKVGYVVSIADLEKASGQPAVVQDFGVAITVVGEVAVAPSEDGIYLIEDDVTVFDARMVRGNLDELYEEIIVPGTEPVASITRDRTS